MLEKCGEKENPQGLLTRMQIGAANFWRFLKNLKMGLCFDTAIPLLGIYPKKPKTLTQKNIFIPVFIAALFTIVKVQKQPKSSSIDEWIKKWWYTYIMEYYCTEKD